jgi:primary-amine oxidase
MVVDLLPPNKTDALAYFNGSAAAPERWAKASIMFAAFEEPYVQEIMVGPLPVSNETIWAPYDYASTKEGGAKIRVYDADSEALYEAYTAISIENADLVMDLLNLTVNGTDADTGDMWGIDPLWHEVDDEGNSHVITWLTFWRYPTTDFYFDGETLLPQGLFIKMDITGRDPSQWHLVGWLYNDIYYTSEGFEKLTPNISGDWIGTDQAGSTMPFDDLPPPMPVQPAGQRFSVDVEEKYVEWMDWSFYITFTRDT